MTELLQSTAQTVVGRGYLSSDHISTATGLDPAITISKNGGNFVNPAAGASVMTEIESTGWYKFALGTGDTDTLGPLIIRGTHATMDNIEVVFQVVAVSVAQTGDSYAIVNHADYGNAKLVRSTTPANTLTVDASHKVAVPDDQKVDLNTIKTQAVTAAAGVTFPASIGTGTSTHSAADVKTALEADGSKLDHLWEMTEDDGGVRRLTANALEESPAAGAAPSVDDIATRLLVTPANKLDTDASGYVSISGTKNTLDALNDAPDVSADVGSIKGTTDKLDTALELDGAVYRYTANALEEGPAGAAGLTAQDVRDAMKLAPSAGAADADSIDDKLDSISSGSGSGTGSYTDTVTDGVNPLDGVRVQLSTDAAGANRVYETYTDALGVFKLNPDPGVYYVWLDLAGYTFTQGAEVTVV